MAPAQPRAGIEVGPPHTLTPLLGAFVPFRSDFAPFPPDPAPSWYWHAVPRRWQAWQSGLSLSHFVYFVAFDQLLRQQQPVMRPPSSLHMRHN